MKKLTCLFFLFSLIATAQDTIFKKDGIKISSFVLYVKKDSVLYKRTDNPWGPDLHISKTEVSHIRYKSGRVDDFDSLANVSKKMVELIKTSSRKELIAIGKNDARKNYKCSGCGAHYAFQTLFFPRRTIVDGVEYMNSLPRAGKLNYPNADLWTSNDYKEGYLEEVLAIKQRNIRRGIWIGAWINGMASTAFFLLIIFGS